MAGQPAAPGAAPEAKAQTGEERLIEAQAIARSRDGGVFVRYAVLKLVPQGPKAYSVLDWRRGTLAEGTGARGR